MTVVYQCRAEGAGGGGGVKKEGANRRTVPPVLGCSGGQTWKDCCTLSIQPGWVSGCGKSGAPAQRVVDKGQS